MVSSKKSSIVSSAIINLIFVMLCIIFIAPFVLVVAISISNEQDIVKYGYNFFPKKIDFASYNYIFHNPKQILDAYKITTVFTALGTLLSVLLMSMVAYPLTKKSLRGRRGISFYIFFTMLFSGGLVPSYILITQYLKLNDTIWVYIFPSLISAWHIFLLRTFFSSIPESIIESSLLDGASEYRIFFTMILPLSKPVLATVALFGVLQRWNDWFTSLLYINKDNMVSLQYLLQKILRNIQVLQQSSGSMDLLSGSAVDIPAETVRMAMAVVAAGPMLIVFPFFQKYFARGLTVGSVKG